MKSREPTIRAKVDRLRAAQPLHTNDQLAQALIRSTRRRVAATGALSGAVAIAPGLGTVLAIGTVTSQTLYALEQEIELVLGIAMIFGHELSGSENRVLEALVVVGLTSGALKLREDVLVAGGERLALAAFRRVPSMLLVRPPALKPGRVAEALAGFELVVGHLADQLRPDRHPLRVLALASRPPAHAARHAPGIGAPLLLGDLRLQRLELGDELLALGR